MGMASYPTKEKRLAQLDMSGLNIADFIHFAKGEFAEDKARAFFEKHKCVSVRTFSDDEHAKYLSPEIYEVKDFGEVKAFCMKITGEYHILINQAIAIKEASITGKIIWEDDIRYRIDYFYGAGTPRDIDNIMRSNLNVAEGVVHLHGRPLSDDAPTNIALHKVVNATQDFIKVIKVRPVILEFQIYPHPIGKRNENIIFWEWLA